MNGTNFTFQDANCDIDGSFAQAAKTCANYFVTPLYFFLSLSGRLISLLAIYEKSKTEEAYLYQIFVLTSESLEIVAYTGYVILMKWLSGAGGSNILWFRRRYGCMWYTAHATPVVNNIFITCTELLTLAMAIDRCVALMKPILYRKLEHRKIQCVTLILCFFLSLGSSVIFGFVLDIVLDKDGGYSITENPAMRTATVQKFFQIQLAFKIILTLLLVTGNFVLLKAYNSAHLNRIKLFGQSQAWNEAVDSWKTLFKMTICQSVCNTLVELVRIGFKIAYWFLPAYILGCILTPLVDMFMELMDILEFYLILAIDKKFRYMVIKKMKELMKWKRPTKVKTIKYVG